MAGERYTLHPCPGTERRENLVTAQPGSTGQGHIGNILLETGCGIAHSSTSCLADVAAFADAVRPIQSDGRMGLKPGNCQTSDNGCETALASPWMESAGPDAGKGKLTPPNVH